MKKRFIKNLWFLKNFSKKLRFFQRTDSCTSKPKGFCASLQKKRRFFWFFQFFQKNGVFLRSSFKKNYVFFEKFKKRSASSQKTYGFLKETLRFVKNQRFLKRLHIFLLCKKMYLLCLRSKKRSCQKAKLFELISKAFWQKPLVFFEDKLCFFENLRCMHRYKIEDFVAKRTLRECKQALLWKSFAYQKNLRFFWKNATFKKNYVFFDNRRFL